MSEIKLPEPAFRLIWKGDRAEYKVNKPNIGDTDCYTADQLIAAIELERQGRGEPVGVFTGRFVGEVNGDALFVVKAYGAIPAPGAELYAAPPAEPVVKESLTTANPTIKESLTVAEPVKGDPNTGCPIPPLGWHCTRVSGHDGPCAAVEAPEEIEIVKRGMDRLRSGQPAEPVKVPSYSFDTKALATAQEIALMWGHDRSQFISRIQVAVIDAMRWACVAPMSDKPACGAQNAECGRQRDAYQAGFNEALEQVKARIGAMQNRDKSE